MMPASSMALIMGSFLIGEEGQAVWRILAAPFAARSLVKSKYFLTILFSLIILAVTGIAGALLYSVSLRAVVMITFEAVFLVFAWGAISLSHGIKGADFNETPRPRFMNSRWSLINIGICLLLGAAILAPLMPYVLSLLIPEIPALHPYLAVAASGAITFVITWFFYKLCIRNATEFLAKAQT